MSISAPILRAENTISGNRRTKKLYSLQTAEQRQWLLTFILPQDKPVCFQKIGSHSSELVQKTATRNIIGISECLRLQILVLTQKKALSLNQSVLMHGEIPL